MILMIEKVLVRSHSEENKEKESINREEDNKNEVLLTETNSIHNPKNIYLNDFPVLENANLNEKRKYKSETKLYDLQKKIYLKKFSSSICIHRLSTIEDLYKSNKYIDKKEKEFKDIVSQLGKISTIVNEKCITFS